MTLKSADPNSQIYIQVCRYYLRTVKRLMKEAAELRDPTEHYHAQPLEDNLFEWHFSVRGPPDSDFDGGIYHGRIVLPPEYPMKPPSIILLTPNGRFEVGKKICLSISGHHPETWQPSWSIRTALIAIIGFMPTKGEGAIGSLDYTPEERRALAKKSQDFCCESCDCLMRSALLPLTANSNLSAEDHRAKKLAQQINFKVNAPAVTFFTFQFRDFCLPQVEASLATGAEGSQTPTNSSSSEPLSPRQRRAQQHGPPAQRAAREPAASRALFGPAPHHPQNQSHAGSAVLIMVLTLALAVLIFRRIYSANEYKFNYDL
uniref:Ubiquitin-conjugating enzyme E2 J1 n=1 Tax=Kryptolebias marmoratus TaxID=37003 RepID=A0A3Q3A6D6_KRYMA